MVNQVNRFGIGAVQPGAQQPVKPAGTPQGPGFQELLESQLHRQEDLKFSAHAMERIRHRGLPLSPQDLNRLKSGVNQISEKGGQESVVLMDNTAYVVSVKNRTVITAIGGEQMRNNVFTKIDSAVIV